MNFYKTSLKPVNLYAKWKPALLGDLPEDFLRLDITPKQEEPPPGTYVLDGCKISYKILYNTSTRMREMDISPPHLQMFHIKNGN